MNSSERPFRADIEGLRAVAVGLVVLAHAGVPWLAGGYIGVDVFFVLSGFLITGLLIRERGASGATSIAGFYARRARRILPAATIVLVATVLASYEWLGFLRGDVIAEDGKWAALFAINLHLAHEGTQYLNVGAPPSPLQHFWSLAVEEQFYLVWPLTFVAVARIAPRVSLAAKLAVVLALVIVGSFAWSVIQTSANPTWAFFSPLTRAWELALGSLLAVSAPHLRRLPAKAAAGLTWAGLAGIVVAAVLLDAGTAFPGAAVALPVLATAMVVAGGTVSPRRGAEMILRLSPFQLLGRWSYSFYLWHWPVLVIAEQRFEGGLSALDRAGLVALALALAVLMHHLIENPVRYARPLTQRPWAGVSLGACLVVAAYGFCGWQLGRDVAPSVAAVAPVPASEATPEPDVAERPQATDPVAVVLAMVAAAPSITSLPPDLEPALEDARWDLGWLAEWAKPCRIDPDVSLTSPECVYGDPDGASTMFLVGDSHAGQWLEAFDEVSKRMNWRLVVLGKAGCPAASVTFMRAYSGGPQKLVGPPPDCGPWREDAIARINESKPGLVVFTSCNGCDYMVDSSGEPISREAWAAGLRETLNQIESPNTKVVILGDNPRWQGQLDCLARNPSDVQACSTTLAAATQVTYNDVERRVADEAGIPFIDVTSWFCGEVCTAVVGNKVVYTNDYHVTAAYARSLSGALETVLRPLIESQGVAAQ